MSIYNYSFCLLCIFTYESSIHAKNTPPNPCCPVVGDSIIIFATEEAFASYARSPTDEIANFASQSVFHRLGFVFSAPSSLDLTVVESELSPQNPESELRNQQGRAGKKKEGTCTCMHTLNNPLLNHNI